MLTPKQRQYLKGLAHSLAPVVRIGKGGLTNSLVDETKKSLLAHELIKVRIEEDDADKRQQAAAKLGVATDSHVAAMIGKVAILYRPRDEKPKIKLPET